MFVIFFFAFFVFLLTLINLSMVKLFLIFTVISGNYSLEKTNYEDSTVNLENIMYSTVA